MHAPVVHSQIDFGRDTPHFHLHPGADSGAVQEFELVPVALEDACHHQEFPDVGLIERLEATLTPLAG